MKRLYSGSGNLGAPKVRLRESPKGQLGAPCAPWSGLSRKGSQGHRASIGPTPSGSAGQLFSETSSKSIAFCIKGRLRRNCHFRLCASSARDLPVRSVCYHPSGLSAPTWLPWSVLRSLPRAAQWRLGRTCMMGFHLALRISIPMIAEEEMRPSLFISWRGSRMRGSSLITAKS